MFSAMLYNAMVSNCLVNGQIKADNLPVCMSALDCHGGLENWLKDAKEVKNQKERIRFPG